MTYIKKLLLAINTKNGIHIEKANLGPTIIDGIIGIYNYEGQETVVYVSKTALYPIIIYNDYVVMLHQPCGKFFEGGNFETASENYNKVANGDTLTNVTKFSLL